MLLYNSSLWHITYKHSFEKLTVHSCTLFVRKKKQVAKQLVIAMMLLDLIHKFLNLVAYLATLSIYQVHVVNIAHSLHSEDVAGKVVVITGASSGIGEHLAYEYARRGACLTIAARREKSLLEVAERAFDLGASDVLVVPADVSNVDDCRRIVDRTISHFGRLDHLVNNAGVTAVALFEEIEDFTNFRSIMDINFWGSIYMTKFAIPYLRRSEGRIIVLSSAASWIPAPRMSLYAASKAAMTLFFEALRIEFGRDIKLTLVTPGYVESEMTQGKFIDKTGKVDVDPQMRDVSSLNQIK
ncbi:hypothetical protein R3W88_009157 [Solanum pinnatisectum]|uniref:Uncharacterized protein n=1 Tax=Solanum pinnatisectum TaxID=50273 RepID=A0AAV9MAR4_9SOLN|nr:hypothetical protein R3W88_009157 [Solanum pinnatisectum]